MSARAQLPLVLLLAAMVRVPFWAEALRTPVDGDMAIVGLMARHPLRSTTLWGQPYGSPLEAWLAAPFLALGGGGADALRLAYFVLGLALVAAAWWLARALDPRAALPAAVIVACPPAYLLLLASLPPPLYPSALALGAVVLGLALRVGSRLEAGAEPRAALALWGALAGLALWTHLMSASAVVASGAYLWARGRSRPRAVATALLALALMSAPAWMRLLADAQGARAVAVSDRDETLAGHLREVLPALHRPLGAVLGSHAPMVADDPDHVAYAPRWAAGALGLAYGLAVLAALRATRGRGPAAVLLAAIGIAVLAFPFPLRSSPQSVRFLTPVFVPAAVLAAWAAVRGGGPRRGWLVALALAALHLTGAARLLAAWRGHDRARAPFLLPDLAPARRALEERGIRRAYASYGPAYRLTFESGERIVASQPWNERFRHYPLPYLDEVRFAKNVAWVLTPAIPTDLPPPRGFEDALASAGGGWQKTAAGPAVVYHSFVPPFAPTVEPLPGAGAGGDGDPVTTLVPDASSPLALRIEPARALDAVALVCGAGGPRLPRSLDVEVSENGTAFTVVARRRRREERQDLRWVNGHPQYVIDHDLLAVPLGGRTVAAIRLRPVDSSDPWALGEVLLHPALPSETRPPWDEWLDPNLSWEARRAALRARPLREREEWYYRAVLAARH